MGIFLFAIVSCNNLEHKDSPDIRFTGKCYRIRKGAWVDIIDAYSYYDYFSYKFHDHNIIGYYSSHETLGKEDHDSPFCCNLEWKLEDCIYYERLYDNQFSDWEVFDIQYIDSSKILINGAEFKRLELCEYLLYDIW